MLCLVMLFLHLQNIPGTTPPTRGGGGDGTIVLQCATYMCLPKHIEQQQQVIEHHRASQHP